MVSLICLQHCRLQNVPNVLPVHVDATKSERKEGGVGGKALGLKKTD